MGPAVNRDSSAAILEKSLGRGTLKRPIRISKKPINRL
jgi:hypothetical protein